MNRFAGWMVLGWMLLAALPTAAQADAAAPPEVPPGFHAVASLENFVPRGRPAVVEGRGLVVPGMVSGKTAGDPGYIAYLWYVETGEFRVIDPPLDDEGQTRKWQQLVALNSRGQLIAHVMPLESERVRIVGDAYLREADGTYHLIRPAGDEFEGGAIVDVRVRDVNTHGVVVGVLSERVNRACYGCFRWSREDGMQIYEDNAPWFVRQIDEISDDGVAIGFVADARSGAMRMTRPVVCLAIDDILVLDLPLACDQGRADAINREGVVLVSANGSLASDFSLRTWLPDQEGESIPHPNLVDGGAFTVYGLSDSGSVLMWVGYLNRVGYGLGMGYLNRDGRLFRLPAFPGAADGETYYREQSREGYIVGYARIPNPADTDLGYAIGFVVSPDAELQRAD